MLKYSLPAAALLVVGLSACLDDTTGPECQPFSNPVDEMRGDTVVTQVGLRYIEVEAGASQQEARWCAQAQVQYVGTLLDGTQFDSGTHTFTPGADNTIAGFVFGVVGMQVGERRRLIVPPNLAYGATGTQDIPPNSTIVFDVELIATQ
jgi:FKBP-type peptidyl-prolyl cis-trans isomerase